MKFSVFFRKYSLLLVTITALLLLSCGPVFASSAEHGDAAAGHKGWQSTDTDRVMNFVVLAAVLFFVLRKPLSQALNGRIKDIKEQLEDLENKKAEAEKALVEYDEKIAALDKEAEEIVAEYIRQGEEARRKILEESKKAAEKLEEQARRSIEHEFKRAKQQLQADIMEKALGKAEGLVKAKITSEDQDRLIGEYLDKVVAQ